MRRDDCQFAFRTRRVTGDTACSTLTSPHPGVEAPYSHTSIWPPVFVVSDEQTWFRGDFVDRLLVLMRDPVDYWRGGVPNRPSSQALSPPVARQPARKPRCLVSKKPTPSLTLKKSNAVTTGVTRFLARKTDSTKTARAIQKSPWRSRSTIATAANKKPKAPATDKNTSR